MPSPFPGMDPYLEIPDLWPDVHHELLSQIRSALNLELRPRYVTGVELRVYVSDDDDPGREALVPDLRIEKPKRSGTGKPKQAKAVAVAESLTVPFLIDDEVKEARLEIRHLESGSLVTVIEVLSPTNKIRGARGRTSFMEKRRETLASEVHWVEIDLLRAGSPSVTNPPPASEPLSHPCLQGREPIEGPLLADQYAAASARDRHSAARAGPRRSTRPGRGAERRVRRWGLRSVHRLSQQARAAPENRRRRLGQRVASGTRASVRQDAGEGTKGFSYPNAPTNRLRPRLPEDVPIISLAI
ncbi:MAG TPA: DUF4058 family protein [Pirellulales bacterium]|nr:DUF4058 family protein [Pirellulales bacterium]